MLKKTVQELLFLTVSTTIFILSSCSDTGTNSDESDGSDKDTNITVTFESNGGSSVELQTLTSGDTIVEPEEPTKSGKKFSGWYSDSILSKSWNFADTVSEDMMLYAQWGDTSTAMILEYIKPENSPLIVTLALKGEVNLTIDWGDGIFESISGTGTVRHEYSPSDSIMTVRLKGTLTHFGDSGVYQDRLREVVSFGDLGLTSLIYAFQQKKNNYNVPRLTLPTTLPSTVKDLGYLFYNTIHLPDEISSWNVSNVTNMAGLFRNVEKFYATDISGWNVSNVTNMDLLFHGSSFSGELSDWDVSSVTTMVDMFGSTTFKGDISQWNVSNVTNMTGMFAYCNFNNDISEWDVSKVTDMKAMFCENDSFNCDIGNWNVSQVTDMDHMFQRTLAFNQDLSKWDVSKVKSMKAMFKESAVFNQDLSGWDVQSVKEYSHFASSNTVWKEKNWPQFTD